MSKDKNSFLFYYNWEDSINELTDTELRSFILNLIHYHQGKEVVLATREEKFLWNGILPALKINQEKYRNKADASRENGKKGGRPKRTQDNLNNLVGLIETQNNLNNPIIDNSQELIDNSEELMGNSYLLRDLSYKEFLTLSTEEKDNYYSYICQLEEVSYAQQSIIKLYKK